MPGESRYASVYGLSDTASLRGQRSHLTLLRLELAIVIVGALLGAIDARASVLSAAVAFVVAIVLRAARMASQPVGDWYGGRAAAESVKTLCWRYAVCAGPFERALSEADADTLFVQRLDDVLSQISALHALPPPEAEGEQITGWMREIRGQPLAARRDTYRRLRIDDQRAWYAKKARAAEASNRRWSIAVLLLECAGAALAIASLAGVVGYAETSPAVLLGVVAALIAAATAWTQARQFGNVAAAYTIAHQELGAILSLMGRPFDEPAWSEFVDSAEGAISREHTMWRAARSQRTG